ncbi:N-6 DNA methylase [Streptomyces sp. WM6386]|nr:N-6 DNA methylase [Streptomyces sp. WM6386]
MTAAEISRIAGVTRATVSNWRRRHDDFPAPSGGTDSSPLYDLETVRAWLAARGHAAAASPAEELRTTLRLRMQGQGSGATADLLLLVLAAARRSSDDLKALAELPDAELTARASDAAADLAGVVPNSEAVSYTIAEAAVLRALLACVRDDGARAALGVLAERELEDSATSGTYQTPEPLADLAARLIPGTATSVLDPACGSGTLLAAAAGRGASKLYGQDTVPVQAQRTAVSLLLTAPESTVTVRTGDSLRADSFPDVVADAVLCNPPYGDRDWGHDELAYDPRWAYGVPARAESELAWVQHALAHLAPGGYAALILPPATASRASGRRVRAELVRSGALRAVVALPAGAAPPLHVGLQIWVLQRPEPGGPERKSVLFVDTATGAGPARGTLPLARTKTGGRPAAVDWAGLSAQVLTAWEEFVGDSDGFNDVPDVARAVPVVDLLDDLADLTPARRVRAAPSDLDPVELAADLDAARSDLVRVAESLAEAAHRSDYFTSGASNAEWRTATASDLVRGGALALLRTAPGAESGVGRGGGPEPRPVLTSTDIARGTGPTGDAAEFGGDVAPVIEEGDVLVRAIADGTGPKVRVADENDAGALLGPLIHLFRPDPARLDSWCLAGFLGAEDNIAVASTGTTVLQVNPGRLRVPLLPLVMQRQYGEAFRRVHELRVQARRAQVLAEETARLLASGLTGGQLVPLSESRASPTGGDSLH